MGTIAEIAAKLREDVQKGRTQRDQLRREAPGQLRGRIAVAATDQQIRKAQRAAEAELDAQDARDARDEIARLIKGKFPGAVVEIRRGRKEWLTIEVRPFASEAVKHA